MTAKSILYPLLAVVVLTVIVAVVLFRRRVSEMRSRRIHPQKVATSAQMSAEIEDSRAADNFRNLFETPVLFYSALVVTYATQLTSVAYVTLAWAYVAARVVHSAIHCTYNLVLHRLLAFAASVFLMWILWGFIAYDLLVRGRG